MNSIIVRLAWLSLIVAGAGLPDTADAGQGPPRIVHGSAAEVLAIAEDAALRNDVRAAEAALRALLNDPAPDVRAEARFRLARMIMTEGRNDEAAVLLRHIIDEHPRAVPARLELAGLLNKLGHEESALRQLRAIRTSDLPPNLARFVDRLAASLQASKPFGVQLELALAPDSNINRATRSDTLGTVFGDFTFDEGARRRSGVGAAARSSAHRRIPLARDLNIVARASADLSLYRDDDFNDISSELSVGPEFRIVGTRFTANVGLGQRWYGMTPYQRQLRLSGSASRTLGAVSQVRMDASMRWSDSLINDLQDGRGLTVRARYERSLSPQMAVAASLVADRFKAQDGAYSTRSWTIGVSAYRELGRASISASAELGKLTGDERLAILPEAREDRLTRVSIGVVSRQFTIAGFAPMTRVVVERNRSNIEFYDFKRTRTEVGVTRAF